MSIVTTIAIALGVCIAALLLLLVRWSKGKSQWNFDFEKLKKFEQNRIK